MGATEASSVLKDTLKGICRSNRWSYGVFWRFDQRNSMLLTLEDICYEEQVGMVAVDMLQQVHMLGEGLVGIAALTGKHRWIFSGADAGGVRSSSIFPGSLDIFQDNSEFQQQFSCGIKTVAVIPVHPHGVIQLGSTQKIFESFEFMVDTKRLLCQVINDGGLVPLKNTAMASSTDICHFDELLASLVSSGNSDDWSLSAMHNDSRRDCMGKSCASMDSNLLHCTSSFDKPALEIPSFSKSSCGTSVLTSSEPLPTLDIIDQNARYLSYLNDNILESHRDIVECGERSSKFTSVSDRTGFLHMDEVQQSAQLFPITEGELLETVTRLPTFHEDYLSEDFPLNLPDISVVEDLFQWFASSPDHEINGATTALNDNFSQSIGVSTVSSDLVEVDNFVENLNKSPVVSSQSSVTHVSHSIGQDKAAIVQNATNELFDSLGLDFKCDPVGKSRKTIMTEVRGSYSGGSSAMSACTSKLAEGSSDLPRKRLFWELGIEELLDGLSNTSSATKSAVENQSSASKRTKMERLSLDSNRVLLSGPCTSMNPTQPSCMVDKADRFLCKKEVPKPQVSSWVDDSYSTNIGGSILEQSRKGEEPAKVGKKRARPGESNRPRPKDRQQIQDRIKELRGIIPNGSKCSIDSLLDRTIKYMLFLQSITKYADKLKQTNKPKLIDQENGAVLNEKGTMERGGSSGGVTWAFKVGATPMVCPVIVEDLSSPGQMLIEMLCEERGFFLEIADMIRSYGLTILKGVMEIREDKIWAQFVVEVKLNTNQSITRINVFLSLMELLQQTNTGGIELPTQSSNVINGGVPLLDCFQNPSMQIPISLAEALQ